MTKHFTPSRRDLLKAGGALVVSFSLAGRSERALAQGAAAPRPLSINEVDAFLEINARGRVTLYSGKVDMGTGVRTALAQICAEELDVPIRSVSVVEGDTASTPDQGKTWGSLTIQLGGMQIRNAAATARSALLDEAAKRFGVKAEELRVAGGVIRHLNRRVSYAELIGGRAFSLKLDHAKPAKFKDPKSYTLVGKSIPRLDIPAKVNGTFPYINNLRVPGMLHGRVIRPPSVGSKLESVDESSIKSIAGIVQVVREGNFLGVVAQTEWAAIKGARDLKATWSKWEGLPEQAKLYEHVRATKVAVGETTGDVGNTGAAMGAEGAI
jgi:nicotinate dehydrogenase subunit B